MLNDLDETIKQILVKAGQGHFDPPGVDISFDLPNRDWSAGIQRPTINCYLFDIHERRSLREEGWRVEGRGKDEARRRKPLLFYDISYLITAWTKDIGDEHYLLWRVLEILSRFPILNDKNVCLDDDQLENTFVEQMPSMHHGRPRLIDCLPDRSELCDLALRDDAPPIYTAIAQLEGVLKSPGEFWTALENQLKPSLNYVVTLTLDRQAMRVSPLVQTNGLRIRLPESTPALGFRINRIFNLPRGVSLQGIEVTIDGLGEKTKTDEQGLFSFPDLAPGRYLISAHLEGQSYQQAIIIRDPNPPVETIDHQDTVRDQLGNPIPGVIVEVEGYGLRTETDANGRFSFKLRPGRYMLMLRFAGRSERRTVTIRSPAHTLNLGYGGWLGVTRTTTE
jgi:hypothetical protein